MLVLAKAGIPDQLVRSPTARLVPAEAGIGVFACYVSRHGHAFLDRALYLPKAWTDDPARMKAAHVPAETRFATKPALAGSMIERALAAKAPFGWVAADSVYGVGSLETMLRRAGKGYVLGVSSDHRVNSWGKARRVAGAAGTVAQGLSPSDWGACRPAREPGRAPS